MVAVAQFIPNDPEQKASVLAVLREHPELQAFIVAASEKASQTFDQFRVTIDTRQFDDWDPPVTMTVWVNQPWDRFLLDVKEYTHWLAHESRHDRDLLFIMPTWEGPIETAR